MVSHDLNGDAYLKHYYDGRENDAENLAIWTFMVAATKDLKQDARVLDLASGPTVYQVTTAARTASSIVMSDLRAELLGYSERWRDDKPEAFNWDPYVQRFLELEAAADIKSTDDVAKRKEKMKSNMHFVVIDINRKEPFVFREPFDLVQNLFLAASAATSHENFFEIWKKFVSYAAPGGDLIIIDVCDAGFYMVGNTKIYAYKIGYEEQEKLVYQLGCEVIAKNFFPAHKGADYGYSGLSMFHLKKPID